MDPVLQEAARRDLAGEPYVLVTVVRTRPPTSAILGAHAIVSQDHQLTGYVGGECTRRILLEVAEGALTDGQPRLLLLSPHPEDDDEWIRQKNVEDRGVLIKPMTCHSGGTVELFVEPHLASPLLLVIGDSPVARYVLQIASHLNFRVQGAAMTPDANWETFKQQIRQLSQDGGFAVLATMGQYDDWAIDALQDAPLSYLGVVASHRRGALLRERFSQGRKFDNACILSIPAGLDVHSRLPEEIAVSIVAEIIQIRRQTKPTSVEVSSLLTKTVVIDPVCHMTVNLSETPYQAVYADQTWGFCASSCRDAFLEDPERYVRSKEA
ncbi:XdhC family protein [Sulfobacillus thermosulfidooxidans]|uniref:XdhC family protein n=1 Tax=Sulfobacillus thermosulfidooxidans TaxID=28034 RepID=UPI0006B54D77|nr:XdhC family protein [Sulfobacillus thermosulfidooxidans]